MEAYLITSLLLIVQNFKHCPPQNSPLYWQYTISNSVFIFGKPSGMHFLGWRAGLALNLFYGLEAMPFQRCFNFGKQEKSLLGLGPKNTVDEVQRDCDVAR
ncbi:hypothetical protein CDAR_567891 [Caerostris darwini]|uniref:Uncharacterized protein n=1 Tax=Caerostris darwini TaxID=1538125 RepID=A0AAV4SLD9_9ARAC|nr:hypothetical protein CDAR_567891 [Caerostris darwini]